MKQIRFDNNRTSSGRNSRSLATKRMLHRVVTMLVLAFVCSGAWATDYVFVYNGNYLGINASGNIENYSTFNPTYCVWTCYNGNNEATLPTGNNNLRALRNGNCYLNSSDTRGQNVSTSTTAQNYWRLDGNYLAYRSSSYTCYLYYRSNNWKTSRSGNSTQDSRYSSSSTDYRATATASTTHTGSGTVTNPSLSSSLISTGIELKHTNISGTFDPTYSQITVGGKTYYKVNGSWTETQPQANSSWGNATYTWTVTSGSGSISNGNVLTITGTTSPVVVKLTSTHTCGYSNEQTLTFNLTSVSALNDQSTTDITITPASTTIDLSGSQTFSVPATISQTTITRDAYVEIKSGSQTCYKVGNTYQTTPPEEVETPGSSIDFSSATWTLTGNDGYLTNSGLTGRTITLTRDNTKKVGDNQTVTISVSASYGTNSKSATAAATIPFTYIDLTALTAGDAINMGIGSTTSINGHFSYTPSDNTNGRPYTSFTYTSANTSVATVDSNGKITAVAPGTTTITVQSKTIDGENGVSCTVTVNVNLLAPAISIDGDGYVTITDNNAAGSGVSIRYTVDGSTPTSTAGTAYNSKFGPVDNLTVVKAVAYKGTTLSAVASQQYIKSGVIPGTGALGGTVILNDYEDHSWTYYQSNDKLPAGYPATYLNSPDPRNVKITYRAYDVEGNKIILGGTATNVGTNNALIPAISGLMSGSNYTEPENVMIYYKTLEKHDLSVKDDGEYAYTVISNPFSKRPKSGDKYYGFAGWKIISGGEFISEYSNEQILPLDKTIHFTNLDNGYTPNCTSAEVVFEATWDVAEVHEASSIPSFTEGYNSYERNFWVLNSSITSQASLSTPCTLMAMYPDGSEGYYNTCTIRGVGAKVDNVKVEFVKMDAATSYTSERVEANGHTLTIGRGVINTNSGGHIYGMGADADCLNTIKIESGKYSDMRNFIVELKSSRKCDQLMILGCDYDRAKNDNSKLTILNNILVGASQLNRPSGILYVRYNIKSGNFWANQTVKGDSEYTGGINQNFYMSTGSYHNSGHRFLLMEGGRVSGIAGGEDDIDTQNTTDRAVTIRIKGSAQIDGNVYGGAEYAGARGIKALIFTGGTINGWIAGGANGTQATGGLLTGSTYVYVGGNTTVKSDQSNQNQVMNRAVGGNVFGAGCGYSATSTSGKVTLGTNVVVSDDAYVERGVYGGGSYGFCADDKTSSLFLLGGTVAGKSGGVNGTSYDNSVQGGVYGGACQNVGGSANIYMDGGVVETGLYGGSNKTGTLSGSVTMQINGGQVGTATAPANIHGGGYGQPTVVKGNVDITLGATDSEVDADGVTVYGDVYGGSALGSVNGTSATTTYHTNVTLNAGTIHGSLYGGALGNSTTAANVYGPVAVKVYGGSVLATDGTGANGSGAVYGCNNIKGAPQRAVTVDIYGTNSHDVGSKATDPSDDKYAIYAVYGGGNQASYTYTETGKIYPQVTVHNCDNSIEYVYGGGNAANVPATQVTIWGGNRIGYVFGGGHGDKNADPQKEANVTGNTEVNIYGGTIGKVFAGSNSKGTIDGTSTVNVNKDGDCAMHIDEVYGGGNEADGKAGTINIDCTGAEGEGIGTVYGGANDADIGKSANKSNIALNITGGSIDNVFGGNNNGGNINGTIAVNVDWATGTDACGYNYLGNVYGAGNKADYTGNPVVNVKNGTVTGNVFGGGLSAKVTGNTDVEVTGGEVKTAVYGGGALADVTGNTTVNLFGGTVNDVYGGGLGRNASGTEGTTGYLPAVAASVGGNTNVTLGGTVSGNLVGSVVTGSIFGCNNVNGTPKGHAKVTILKTTPRTDQEDDEYDVAAVYGGGNQAAYIPDPIIPTSKIADDDASAFSYSEVFVSGCDNSIEYVYGGGNAASTPATKVTIEGGEMYYVFGGGNGKTEDGAATQNPGADVGYKNWTYDDTNAYGEGTTNVNIYGGTIAAVFGGSNTKGNIRVESNVTLDDKEECDFKIGDVYGAGNEAEMYGNGNLTIGCIPGLKEMYGGAKNADINGDVSITITNGEFEKVFGGNNLGGDIKGSITVNIEETGCRPIKIGELYGGGNLAAYTAPTATTYGANAGKFPMVNVKSFTSIGTVYGGGLGMSDDYIDALSKDDLKKDAEALGTTADVIEALTDEELKALKASKKTYFKAKGVVHGSPQVNINMIEGKFANGGSHGSETFPAISNKWNNKLGIIGTVYGGGNAANVEGDTYVNIGTVSTINLVSGTDHSDKSVEGVNISGNVYGGGNAADVTGKTNVQIGQAGTTSSGE